MADHVRGVSITDQKSSSGEPLVPTIKPMAAVRDDYPEIEETAAGRRRNWLLGLGLVDRNPPSGVPNPITLSDEIELLRVRLAEAERRAVDAEGALPHLLNLGQRTVDGLLEDARKRAREIIETAQAEVAEELIREREALRLEKRELEGLHMAVAAEAMSLEALRSDAEAMSSTGSPPLTVQDEQSVQRLDEETGASGEDLEEVSRPRHGFADAWEAGEDASMADAFDRFFEHDLGEEPSREWILADDPRP